MKNHEAVLDLYEIFALPFAITVTGGVVYFYNLIMHAATP